VGYLFENIKCIPVNPIFFTVMVKAFNLILCIWSL